MRRTLLLVLFFIGLTGFTLVEHPVFINGKSFANAVGIQGGIIAVSLEDFARAVGAGPSLEPNLQLQGTTLTSVVMPSSAAVKVNGGVKITDGTSLQHKATTVYPKINSGQIFRLQNGGTISQRVMMEGGKAWVPLEDIARAFGDGSVRINGGTLKPGEPIRLNLAANPRGILIGL